MSRVTVKVQGLVQAQGNIRQVLQNVEVGTDVALDVVAAATLKDADEQVPVGTPESTGIPDYIGGTLKSSLQIYKAKMVRQVGTDNEYAWYVHDGTYLDYPSGGMPARPYLTNPFEANQNQLVTDCQKMKVW